MIHILTIEKIRAQLACLPLLFEKYQQGALDFPDATIAWMDATEKELGNLRLTELSELVVLRGRILKAAEESPTSDTLTQGKRARQRARRNVAAVEAADRAESILRGRIQNSESRLQVFEDKLCEGLAAFLLENPFSDSTTSFTGEARLRAIWGGMAQYAPTRPLVTYLSAALASTDRFYLLEQIMRRVSNK